MVKFSSDVEAADALAGTYKNLSSEISKVIVGQEDVVRLVLTGIFLPGTFAVSWCSGSGKNFIDSHHFESA